MIMQEYSLFRRFCATRPRFAVQSLALALLLAVAAMLPAPHPARAAASAAFPVTKAGTTRIVAEKMVYDSEKNTVVFEGNVHVTRPDIQIWSELLTLYLVDGGNGKASSSANMGMRGGKADRIVAERNVRIKQDNKTGTSGRATYFVPQGKILMEQNPVIIDGDNRIKGKIINYFTETGHSEVIGDVDVQFTTEDVKAPGASSAPDKSGTGRAPQPRQAGQ